MSKHVLTVTLNPALDKTILYSNKEDFKRHICLEDNCYAGGKGVNVARTLDNLGIESVSTGFIGGESGKQLLMILKKEGIRSNFLKTSHQTRINETHLSKKGRLISRVMRQGKRVSDADLNQFLILYKKLLKKSSFVVLSGRKAYGMDNGIYAQLITIAHRNGIKVLLDTSGKPLKEALKAQPDFIKPNLEEFQKLSHLCLESVVAKKEAIDRLHKKGVHHILLSLAKNGVIGSDGKEIWHVTPRNINSKNEVGCGDAFVAGFVYALLHGKSFRDSLGWATAAGTASAMNLMPGLTSRKKVLELRKVLRFEKLN